MIPIQQDKLASIGEQSHAAKHKPNPFRSERMWTRQIHENLFMQAACESDLNLHFFFVNPVRCATRIFTRVGDTGLTFHENANQFFSQIRALMTFQFRV